MCVCVYVCVCMCVCVCVACEWHVKVSYVCVSVCHMCLSVCERDPWREKACVLAFLVCLCYVVCVYAMTGECMYVCVCVCVCVVVCLDWCLHARHHTCRGCLGLTPKAL
jgi:hypothetical protein